MGWNSCYFKFIRPTFFKVPPRSVRDRYSLLLVKKYKSKRRAEDKASGRAPNHTEIDEALLDLIERFDEADIARRKAKAEKKKVEEKLVQIQNMQNVSLETCGDTRKRKENGEGSQKRSRRSTSNDCISYFSEKHEREISLRQEELKLRKQELDLQAWFMQFFLKKNTWLCC